MGYPCSMFIFSIPDATTPEMFPVHLFYPRSHHTSNVPCPSFSLPVPTSAWMEPKRNSHGSASLARADRKKTLGISSGSLGEKYSWISPLKFALLPLNPHWKSGEVFPNGMSSHELGTLWFPALPCMQSVERTPPCMENMEVFWRVKYSWISSLKSDLLPIYPHWKTREGFPNRMNPHKSQIPIPPCMECTKFCPPWEQNILGFHLQNCSLGTPTENPGKFFQTGWALMSHGCAPALYGMHGCSAHFGGEIFPDFSPEIDSAPYLLTLEFLGSFSKWDEPPRVPFPTSHRREFPGAAAARRSAPNAASVDYF